MSLLGAAGQGPPIFTRPVEVVGWAPTDLAPQGVGTTLRYYAPSWLDLDHQRGLVCLWQAPAPSHIGVTHVSWSTLLTILASVARFAGCAAVPTSSQAFTGAGEHVLWVGQWAGTGLAVFRCSSCGISIVARCTQLAELPSGVVLALRAGSSLWVAQV